LPITPHPRLLRKRARLMMGGNPAAGRLRSDPRCSPRLAGSRRFALSSVPASAHFKLAFGISARRDIVAHIEGIAVRTLGGILIILVGLAWEFSAKFHIFVDQVTIQKWQAWLAAHTILINQIAPLALIGGGVFWIVFLHARPALQRWLRPSPLEIVYRPPAQTSVWRSMRDYYIEVRNCSTDRTISSVIVTWDETVFTRAIDKKLSRDCLLSPTSIEPSSSVSVFLFRLRDDIRAEENKNSELGRESTFTIRVSGNGTNESTARFRYEPDKIPKLRKLWR
jgi:hypothetical protein